MKLAILASNKSSIPEKISARKIKAAVPKAAHSEFS